MVLDLFAGLQFKQFFQHLIAEIRPQQLFDGAAVLSFYFFLSIFPLLFVFISLATVFALGELGPQSISWWQHQVPPAVSQLITSVLKETHVPKSGGVLSLFFILAVLLASNGIAAVIRQLNVIYKVKNTRNFLVDRFYSILLTLGFGLFTIIPFWIDLKLGHPEIQSTLLGLFLFLALVVIYYIGPHVRTKFRFTVPGALFGALLLVLSTKGFEAYIQNFSDYGVIYGSLGAVIILLLWLYLLGILIISGGYINHAVRVTLGFDKN